MNAWISEVFQMEVRMNACRPTGRSSLRRGGLLVLLICLVASKALAQRDNAFERLDPAHPSDRFLVIPDAGPSIGRGVTVGALYNHSHRPLSLGFDNQLVIAREGVLHLQVAARPFSAPIQVGVGLPLTLARSAPATFVEGTPYPAADGTGLGEPKVDLRWGFVEQDGWLPSAALFGAVWLPLATQDHYLGGEELSYSLGAVLGAEHGPFYWLISAERRTRNVSADAVLASELQASAGLGARLGAGSLGVEGIMDLRTGPRPSLVADRFAAELLASGRYRLGDFTPRLAVGTGLTEGVGTPDWRAVVGLAWSYDAAPPGPRGLKSEAEERRRRARELARLRELRAESTLVLSESPRQSSTAADVVVAPAGGAVKAQAAPAQAAPAQAAPAQAAPAQAAKQSPAPKAKDRDGDGVSDAVDDCASAFGTGTAPGQFGCPWDSDEDGIWDHEDACPEEVGKVSKDAAKNGCAPEVRIEGTQVTLSRPIRFELGKGVISKDSIVLLESFAAILLAHPEIVRVAVEGHTDNVGSERNNLQLSRMRAVAVARWLSHHGVDARRIQVRGHGPRRPLVSNDTEEGRTTNRRVELTILRRDPRGERSWKDGPLGAESQHAEPKQPGQSAKTPASEVAPTPPPSDPKKAPGH